MARAVLVVSLRGMLNLPCVVTCRAATDSSGKPLVIIYLTSQQTRRILVYMSDHATLRDAILHFAEFENCREFMVELRWADGKVKCPTCGAEKVTWLAKRRGWKCYSGHKSPTFSLKTGTIFEDSPIGLEKWLPSVWMLMNCMSALISLNTK